MSVRPIDIQISIQRTNEYTKEADLQNQKVNINQFTNTREFQQVIDNAQRQVIPTGHIYHKRIDKEHDRRHRHSRYAKSDQVKDKKCDQAVLSNKVEIKERDKGFNIDIRI
ncbi:hypothetical protein KVG29_08145 [Caldicoprobacter algeriensis]|uniref:hypothetical protein n=1 Tax=Caldicoprobacter algeriensis TaxID=699281 RepID=UPI00207A7C11|nr:hypothetical protein [Caldicoprobacter algeriensis]MCM8901190.1 hypothetical protein [Caldicoprobacter algeriensis]